MITELPTPEVVRDDDLVPDLAASVHPVGRVCVLRLTGCLHAGSLSALQRQFDRLGRSSWRHVVLDLGALTAVDAAGARLLTGLHHYVVGRGGLLSVVGASPSVVEALAGTSLAAGRVRSGRRASPAGSPAGAAPP